MSFAKNRPSEQEHVSSCRHSVDGIHLALVPYTQLCWLSKDQVAQCRNVSIDNDVEPTADGSRRSIPSSNPATASDVIMTSGTANCRNSSRSPSENVSLTSQNDIKARKNHRPDDKHIAIDRHHPVVDNSDKEVTVSGAADSITLSGHSEPITSCQLLGNSHIVTSSLDHTVRLWSRTGQELDSYNCASPVNKVVYARDEGSGIDSVVILCATKSGHLVIIKSNDGQAGVKAGVTRVPVHVPNPITAMAISADRRHLVTGSCFKAFDFVNKNSSLSRSSSSCKLARQTRGSVKTWNMAALRGCQSQAELAVTCSRTAHQLTSSVTQDGDGGYGVTCLALTEDSLLLAVGLSSLTRLKPSSFGTSAGAAVVVVCNRETLQTLWIAENLTCARVYDAVFVCHVNTWSLFIASDTAVEMLSVSGNASSQIAALACMGAGDGQRKLRSTVRHQLIESSSSPASVASLQLSHDRRLLAACVGQVSAILDAASASLLPFNTGDGVTGRALAGHVTSERLMFVASLDSDSADSSPATSSRKSTDDADSDSGVGADVAAPFLFIVGVTPGKKLSELNTCKPRRI